MEGTGFLEALNSAPVPGIKIKKKKTKAVSPTTNKVCHIRHPSFVFMLHGFVFSPDLQNHKPTHLSYAPQPCPFDGRPETYPSTKAKPSSPETPSSQTPPHENQDLEQPGTPVPTEDADAMETGESSCIEIDHSLTESHTKEYKMLYFVFQGDKPNALSEPRGEEEGLTKKGKKKKSVRWAEEDHLKEYFYFDLDETERGKATFFIYTTV